MRYLHTLDGRDVAVLVASENEIFEDEPKDNNDKKADGYGYTDTSRGQAQQG